MPKFIVLLKQDGGCDYTIGCGRNWQIFDADDLIAAKNRVRDLIVCKRDDRNYGGEMMLASMSIAEIVGDLQSLPLDDWYGEAAALDREETVLAEEAVERAQLVRLQAKYGK